MMPADVRLFTEDAVAYALYQRCVARRSRVFLKLGNNFSIDRAWYYSCAPDVDLFEVRADGHVVAYELKGSRRKKGQPEFPALYDGIGQAVAYLDLPRIYEGNRRLFEGGVFDHVYLVSASNTAEIDPGERRILSVVPIGGMLALPDGGFEKVKEAPRNPMQSVEAKRHFLQNLESLNKYDNSGRTFRRVKERGEEYFNRGGPSS